MFQERLPKKIERDMQFFLNSEYDFEKKIWKSGFFNNKIGKYHRIPSTIGFQFSESVKNQISTISASFEDYRSDSIEHPIRRFKTEIKDDRIMFYQNIEVKSQRKALCEAQSDVSKLEPWCMTKLFRFFLLSSNNSDFFKTRKGFVICENDSEYTLIPASVSFLNP